jgi:C1A family cysteine protease
MGDFDVNFFRGSEAGLGWLPEHPDPNDVPYQAVLSASSIPNRTQLRELYPQCFQPIVHDQLTSSSCVGQAVNFALEFSWAKAHNKYLDFSPLGIYALARKKRGWLNKDIGSFIRDAAYQVAAIGICLNSFHPFRMSDLYKDLDAHAYAQCARHRITNVRRLERKDVVEAIANHLPVVGGLTVFRQCFFGEEAQRTGYVRLPRTSDTFGGGHALFACGYDLTTGRIRGPNSWGSRWGNQGWWEADLDYVYNPQLSDDWWSFDVKSS